jgi:Domain of unknown function (DUF1932)
LGGQFGVSAAAGFGSFRRHSNNGSLGVPRLCVFRSNRRPLTEVQRQTLCATAHPVRFAPNTGRSGGVEKEVIASLQGTYPGIDWAKLAAHCVERVARQGIRRAEEMQAAGDKLGELGFDSALCIAIAGVQRRSAKQ